MLEILYNIYKKIAYGDINYAIFLLNYLICAISGFAIIFFNSFHFHDVLTCGDFSFDFKAALDGFILLTCMSLFVVLFVV